MLVEDWFTGVRPRFLVVPCPHCSHSLPAVCSEENPDNCIPLKRSFSLNPHLRPPNEHSCLVILILLLHSNELITQGYPYSAPNQARIANTIASQTASRSNQRTSRWGWGRDRRQTDQPLPPSNAVFYAFQYEECVMRARDDPYVKCPVHGDLPLEYLAPDTVS